MLAAVACGNPEADRTAVPPPIPPPKTVTEPSPAAPPKTVTAPPSVPPTSQVSDAPQVVSLAGKLEIPWALDFLPDGSIIFTERPGRIRLIDSRGSLVPEPLLSIGEVAHRGEGGLLGLALHPGFAQNRFVYVYYTYQRDGGLANRVVRFRMNGRSLVDKTIILDGIPAASIHDGGRLKFGPDGLLYITAGDASNQNSAQDKNALSGKILRLKDDGSIPSDNPFPGSPVYSYGHRNPEGLAWDDRGRLWETEHGSSATDEVNLVLPGRNYGWPVIRGNDARAGMESPVVHSGSDTWAPTGAAFLNGSLFFGGLRGQSLLEIKVDSPALPVAHFKNRFGRLRDVVVGPDGYLYILTSNRDGRGAPSAEDDQLLRVNPEKLK
ncbi:MAG: PQQ-dependent sugar dehydrogenase [Chloroflexi bacterium]|nr:PQQ-dependent sugar dehydrogenase [Chloroflexota bacterium]